MAEAEAAMAIKAVTIALNMAVLRAQLSNAAVQRPRAAD
jgi:hypothetical protein